MDHGDSAATCVLWWAVDGDGNCFCFREYYVENKLISEHRQAVTMLSQNERYMTQFADPSIFSPSMQKHDKRWSVSEEYADVQYLPRENAIYWQKGDNDELGTRNRISEYLRPQGVWELRDGKPLEVPRIHPITKEKGLWPRLFFIRRTEDYPQGCNQAIIQIRSQSREKIGTLNGKLVFSDERDLKVADHAYDPTRYFLASQPPAPNAVPQKYSAKSFFGQMALAHKFQKNRKSIAKLAKREYLKRYG